MIEYINGAVDFAFLRNLQQNNQDNHQHSPALPGQQSLDTSDQRASLTPRQVGTGVDTDNHDQTGLNTEADESVSNQDKVDGSGVTEERSDIADQVENGEPETEGQLTEEEQARVQQLKQIDREVRAHEMAHLAAAQGIALSGANFDFERGPDGVQYAVGGDVQIDTSKEDDPEQTVAKARKIIAAAQAPADPSGQDRSVAASAQAMKAEAEAELAREKTETGPTAENAIGEVDSIEAEGENSSDNRVQRVFENTVDERPNPGIGIYQQNQQFAPSSPLNPEFETIGTSPNNFAALAQQRPPVTGNRLDLVA